MVSIEGFVLAGGQSRRMGQDKAQMDLGGLTMVERAAKLLSRISEPVYAVGNFPSGITALPMINDEPDEAGRKGALIGIYSALLNARSEWAAILACDLPLVGPDLFTMMVSLCEQCDASADKAVDAILPRQKDSRIQPLCGLYRVQTCLPQVKKILSRDNWKLQDLALRLNTHVIEFPEYAHFDGAERWFLNVNTPDAFQTAVENLI